MNELREQVDFVRGLGVVADLLVDPSQAELEVAILEGSFDCAFSPISRCYARREDGQVVPRGYDIYAVLERLDQPFIGSSYYRSLLVDDKTLASGRHGLAPDGILVTRALMQERPAVALRRLESLPYPSIVKPNSLGGSFGIDAGAVVCDSASAFDRLSHIFERFSPLDEVRVERFLADAREFTVAVLGNGGAVATSVTEVIKPKGPRSVYGEGDKLARQEARQVVYATVMDGVLRGALSTLAHDVFRKFGLRDLARFDLLLENRLYVIDINVPPVLSNSFSHEWQALYGCRKVELVAFVLAAFNERIQLEGRPSRVPSEVIATVPPNVLMALRPL